MASDEKGACRSCGGRDLVEYTITPPPLPGRKAKPEHGHLCRTCRLYNPKR